MEKESKEVEEKSTIQDSSPEEKKDNNPEVDETTKKNKESEEQQEKDSSKSEDGEEMVSVSKAYFDKMKQRAEDFEKSTKLRRILKFKNQANPDRDDSKSDDSDEDDYQEDNKADIIEQAKQAAVEEASRIMLQSNKKEFDENLSKAYGEWIKTNPWADSDDIAQELSKGFSTGGKSDVESIVAALDSAALKIFPNLYKDSMEKRIRARLLARENDIDVGNGGGSSSEQNSATTKQYSKKDKEVADRFFDGNVERYLKYKNK